MRTTLDIPDETFRQLKSQAALSGLKLKELVAQLIQRGLAAGVPVPQQNPTASGTTNPACVYPIPIAREADGTCTPYLTNAKLHAILDEDDLVQYQRVRSTESGQ
ncbi:MAG: hypothetical protein IPH35_06080 [Rhodoferax sp.]|nr:hypothetical protein [Rhodoferax sp.]